jgi:hypothetical protein
MNFSIGLLTTCNPAQSKLGREEGREKGGGREREKRYPRQNPVFNL